MKRLHQGLIGDLFYQSGMYVFVSLLHSPLSYVLTAVRAWNSDFQLR